MPRIQYAPTFSPVRGLKKDKPSTMIDTRFTPNCKNVFMRNGEVHVRTGYPVLSTKPVTLLDPVIWIDQWFAQNGASALVAFTLKNMYKYDPDLTSWQCITRSQLLENCEDAWDEQVIANVTAATDTDRIRGSTSAKFTVAAAFTTGIIGTEAITSINITTRDHIHFYIKSTVAHAAGDLQLLLDDTALCASPQETINLPAINANEWTAVSLAIATPASLTAVISVGLKAVVDPGACTILIDDVRATKEFTGSLDDRWSVAIYLDKLYASNNKNEIQEWDGSADSASDLAGATALRAKEIRSWKDRLNIYNVEDTGTRVPQRVKFTAINSTSFTAAGSGQADLDDDPDFIQTAEVLGDVMIIYKERNLIQQEHIGGTAVYRFDKMVSGIGVPSKEVVANLGDYHIFMGWDNFYTYRGGLNLEVIGDSVAQYIRDQLSDAFIGRSFQAVIEELNEVWFFIPVSSSATPNRVWRYNYVEDSWTEHVFNDVIVGFGYYEQQTSPSWGSSSGAWGAHPESWSSRTLQSAAPIILLGGNGGKVFNFDFSTYGDNGANVEAIFDTADIIPSPDYRHKRYTYEELLFEAKGTSVDIYYSRDLGLNWTLVGTTTLTNDWAPYAIKAFRFTDKQARFRFYKNGVSFWSARQFSVGFKPRTDR